MRILTIEDFAGMADRVFTLVDDGAETPLTLTAVTPLPLRAGAPGRAPFSLLFRSDNLAVLPQRIYALRHPEQGMTEMFLVPVAREEAGILYEAVFN